MKWLLLPLTTLGASVYGIIWSLTKDNYTSVVLDLGHGPIRTNYGQAYAICASVFGQKTITTNQTMAQMCHQVGNVDALCTTIAVISVIMIIGSVIGIVVGAAVVADLL